MGPFSPMPVLDSRQDAKMTPFQEVSSTHKTENELREALLREKVKNMRGASNGTGKEETG